MNKQSVIYLLILLIIGLGITYVVSDNFSRVTQIPVKVPVVVEKPAPLAPDATTTPVTVNIPEIISSPLTVTGKAPGNWFFEATLGLEILDANGKSLGIAPAMTRDEWMTTDLVSFEGEIIFATSTTATGTLVVHADDPAGLGNRPKATFPVKFR